MVRRLQKKCSEVSNLSVPDTPEFDSSRHFRQVDFNEINHLEAIFTFFCGGTFFQYKLLIAS